MYYIIIILILLIDYIFNTYNFCKGGMKLARREQNRTHSKLNLT